MVILLFGAAGYSWVAASTQTFTVPAEVTTTIPLALIVGAVVAQPRLRHPFFLRGVGPQNVRQRETSTDKRGRFDIGLWIWGVLIFLLSAWELGNLFAGTRQQHPTISSFLDTATQHHGSKAALYLLWLLFGVYLLRR